MVMNEIGEISATATPEQAIVGVITMVVMILAVVLLVFVQARIDRRREQRQHDAERRFAEAVARGDLQDAEAQLQRILYR
jgi:hypothetical protein